MTQQRPPTRRLQPATPPPSNRPPRPMPRRRATGDGPAPPSRPVPAGRTFLGRPWPLPLSPLGVALLAAFAAAVAAAWALEGRFETPPAEAAKLVSPYSAAEVQAVELTTAAGSATYTRDANGKFSTGGPEPEPTPTPGPDATPAPVTLSPATKLESLLNQLHDLRIDRVVANEASSSPEYGLDNPQFTLKLVPKRGPPATLAVGQLNPDQSAYYARREARGDTVLVSRYTLDDLMKVVGEILKGQ